jgi:RAMP superfamily protein
MNLTVPSGHHFLCLAALTPANCGDTGGSAAVDRPLAVGAWSGLPYLPHSALKGVLAGRRGNVQLSGGGLNKNRTQLFGAPDLNDDGKGRAGDLVFGDAEALAFPLLLRDGRRAMVVVAATLRQLAGHGLLPEVTVRYVDEPSAWEGPVASSDLPLLPEPLTVARFGIGAPALSELLGFPGPVIVAAAGAARSLWQAAVEERTLTALGEDGLVRDGSLRTVELIPTGALFVSLVSNVSAVAVDLGPASPIQLGAWEGTGCGYFSVTVMSPLSPSQPPSRGASHGGAGGVRPKARHETMRTVLRAMRELKDRPEAARARSAIFDLGPRLAQRGLAVTLAFCLAKSGGGEDEKTSEERVKTERAAYRWILRQFFAPEGAVAYAALHARVVAAIREGEAALPAEFHETRLWLRRYAETLLPKEADRE